MTPQWMTQERLAKLAELCERDDHLCLKGHRNCPEKTHYQWAKPHTEVDAIPIRCPVLDTRTGLPHRDKTIPGFKFKDVIVWEWESAFLHNVTAEETIASWQADDREERALEWKREQQAIIDGTYGAYGQLTKTGRDGIVRAPFDPVSRDVFMAQRPEYYLTATGVDGMHASPVAVVRVPSTDKRLFVDVSAAFVKTTKGQRRHARRHGKSVQEVTVTVEDLCKEAVRLWWARRS